MHDTAIISDDTLKLRDKALKRKWSFSDVCPPVKRIKLDYMHAEHPKSWMIRRKYIENQISERSGASDSPFSVSLHSNIGHVDEIFPINLFRNFNAKFSYKVTEIYQIGFQVGDTERIYVPNMLNFQDVTYPYDSNMELTEHSVNDIWNNITPMILDENYSKELSAFKSEGIAQLEEYLMINLETIIDRAIMEKAGTMLREHVYVVDLRQSMMQLIMKTWPSVRFEIPFDASSVLLDNLVDCLIATQTGITVSEPVVRLHRNFGLHLDYLRQRSLALIKIILPKLQLPPQFDIRGDLHELIHRICSVN